MRDVVVVEVHEGAQQLLHDQRGLALGQVLALQDEVEKLATTAVPTPVRGGALTPAPKSTRRSTPRSRAAGLCAGGPTSVSADALTSTFKMFISFTKVA